MKHCYSLFLVPYSRFDFWACEYNAFLELTFTPWISKLLARASSTQAGCVMLTMAKYHALWLITYFRQVVTFTKYWKQQKLISYVNWIMVGSVVRHTEFVGNRFKHGKDPVHWWVIVYFCLPQQIRQQWDPCQCNLQWLSADPQCPDFVTTQCSQPVPQHHEVGKGTEHTHRTKEHQEIEFRIKRKLYAF